jgi:hypothetical protein
MLREFLTAELLPVIARFTRQPDAPLRSALIIAHLMGIAMLRHVLRLEPIAKATPDEIARLAVPVIEQYLREG